MFDILYQDFYIFPYDITTWTIGLLDYCSLWWSLSILYTEMFNILYQDFYIVFPMYNIKTWTIGLLDYCYIGFSLSILLHMY